MNKKIKNIIFDIGDVLINLDSKATISCFEGAEISAFFGQELNPDFVIIAQRFERGEITPNQFRKNVCKIFKIDVSVEKFDKCWNAMIGNLPENRVKMLRNLSEKYKMYVLSNTNEIHFQYFSKEVYWNSDFFEKIYFSHHLKMRKPEPRIFKHILSENNLIAAETLFVDDNEENIASAKKLGINAVLVDEEIEDIFRELGIYK